MPLSAVRDWGDLSMRLTKLARAALGGGSWDDAEDLAQRAITRLFEDAGASWDETKHPDVFDHLVGVVFGMVSNDRRAHARRTRDLDQEAWDAIEGNVVSPERALAGHELAAHVMAALEEAFADDAAARGVVACFREGIDGRSEQAEAMHLSDGEVRNVRKRVQRKAEAALRRIGGRGRGAPDTIEGEGGEP